MMVAVAIAAAAAHRLQAKLAVMRGQGVHERVSIRRAPLPPSG